MAPHTDFNPVLLKPTTDGAQVIVGAGDVQFEWVSSTNPGHGGGAGFLGASDLAYEAVLVEGAGWRLPRSICRIVILPIWGLPKRWIARSFWWRILVKGGVFAHLVGTLALLSESEQAQVKGLSLTAFGGI